MLRIIQGEWFATKKHQEALTPSASILLTTSSTDPVAISAVDEDGEVIPVLVHNGTQTSNFKLVGFREIQISCKTLCGVKFSINERQVDEPHNHEAPPAPPMPDNLMAQLREKVRAELGVNRENFLENDTPFDGYEIPDDAPDVFEEDEAAAREIKKTKKPTPPASDEAGDDLEADDESANAGSSND